MGITHFNGPVLWQNGVAQSFGVIPIDSTFQGVAGSDFLYTAAWQGSTAEWSTADASALITSLMTPPPFPSGDIAVMLSWQERGIEKSATFSSSGDPSGALDISSTVNFTTGTFSVKPFSGVAIDNDTLRVTYLPVTVVPPEDAEITSDNILAYLGADYGVTIDRHDPESLQRSLVYNAYQLWDLKGTDLGYQTIGKIAGFDVETYNLYKVSYSNSQLIDSDHLFSYIGQEVPDEVVDSLHVAPAVDGVAVGPFTIEALAAPIYQQSNVIINWIEKGAAQSVYFDNTDTLKGGSVALVVASGITRSTGTISLTFASGHPPDANSITLDYFPTAFYTDLSPKTVIMDDVGLDVITLDMYCFDASFPTVAQSVNVTSVASVGTAIQQTYLVTVDTSSFSDGHESFGTEGTLKDANSNTFSIFNYQRISNTTYQFEVVSPTVPATGNGSVTWSVLKDVADFITDNPGTTTGSTISPSDNGSNLGPFTIQLANFPIWTNSTITINWSESSVAKTATLTGTTTVGGTNAANISSASINRTTGALTVTFVATHAPDTDSIRITYSPEADLIVAGVGTDIVALGAQYFGFTGIRYRLTASFVNPLAIGNVGRWKIIDSNGVSSYIEKLTQVTTTTPYQYTIEFISGSVPAAGPVNIYYSCELLPSCNYCAASVIRFIIRTGDILNHPDALTENAYDRLQTKLAQMIPVHVRVAEYHFYTGPTTTSIPFTATSTTTA